MNEIAELPVLRTVHPAIHVIQWDGRPTAASGVSAALAVALDDLGADVVHANYRAQLSAQSPILKFTVAREDDGSSWVVEMRPGSWLALWTLEGRLVAVDVYDEADGTDRFVRVAPVITLRPMLGQQPT